MRYLSALLLMLSMNVQAGDMFLHYQYNKNVIITISNIKCPDESLAAEYPLTVVAVRVDGQRLLGCYKPQDKDNIKIQWRGGDFTVLPANAFLQGNQPSQPKATL